MNLQNKQIGTCTPEVCSLIWEITMAKSYNWNLYKLAQNAVVHKRPQISHKMLIFACTRVKNAFPTAPQKTNELYCFLWFSGDLQRI